MDLAQERGASSWLTILPLEEFGLTLHKGAFRDAIALRYGWKPALIPSTCACGTSFSVEHALSCPMGGFPIVRHNEVRDLTAKLMSEVYHDVCIEPTCNQSPVRHSPVPQLLPRTVPGLMLLLTVFGVVVLT